VTRWGTLFDGMERNRTEEIETLFHGTEWNKTLSRFFDISHLTLSLPYLLASRYIPQLNIFVKLACTWQQEWMIYDLW